MTKEFNLSDKIVRGNILHIVDIKEFIRKIKVMFATRFLNDDSDYNIQEAIDKLAGSKLV